MSQPANRAGTEHVATGRMMTVNFIACLLLLVQFLLGMLTNLFVTIPGQHPGRNAASYFGGVVSGVAWAITRGPLWLAVHASLGLALVVAAAVVIVLSWRRGGGALRVTAVLGALFILGAGFNGASFVNYGHDISSMIMSGLWALALACYLTGLFLAGRRHRS